jgi:hypothetical protein
VARTSVAEAAASPRWQTRSQFPLSGDVVTLKFNAAVKGARDRRSYPVLLTVRVQATAHDQASYPVAAESPRFAELMTTISELISGHAVLAAAAASSSGWIFLVYADAGIADWGESFEASVRSAAADHLVGFNLVRDTKWVTFSRLTPRTANPVAGAIVAFVALPLIGMIPAASYKPAWAWAVGGAASILAWLVPLAVARKHLLAAQLAHPAGAFAAFSYVLATMFFPIAVHLSNGARLIITLGISVGLGVALIGAFWPAQQRFYARMRARAQLAQPTGAQPTGAQPTGD